MKLLTCAFAAMITMSYSTAFGGAVSHGGLSDVIEFSCSFETEKLNYSVHVAPWMDTWGIDDLSRPVNVHMYISKTKKSKSPTIIDYSTIRSSRLVENGKDERPTPIQTILDKKKEFKLEIDGRYHDDMSEDFRAKKRKELCPDSPEFPCEGVVYKAKLTRKSEEIQGYCLDSEEAYGF